MLGDIPTSQSCRTGSFVVGVHCVCGQPAWPGQTWSDLEHEGKPDSYRGSLLARPGSVTTIE